MQIALISDTHDNVDHVKYVSDYLRSQGINVVLHAGDVTHPYVLEILKNLDVWIARGNMDRNDELPGIATQLFGEDRFASSHDIELAGHRIALVHAHDRALLQGLAYSKTYEYVVRGHTHAPQDRCIKNTRVLNPGAVGNTGWRRSTFAILDIETGELQSVFI